MKLFLFISIILYIYGAIYYAQWVSFKHEKWHAVIIAPLNLILTPFFGWILWRCYYRRYWFSRTDYLYNIKQKKAIAAHSAN